MASTIAPPVPAFVILYNTRNITQDISPYILGVSFSDKLSGEADEIELNLEDSAGIWRDSWYPGKGDTLTLKLGFEGQALLNCGRFSIDEVELAGSPDTLTLRGISASINAPLRTQSNRAFEKTTLLAIASRIAQKHHLQLQGSIEEIYLDRVTQYQETDVAFLTRLGKEYGYMVKITQDTLIFSQLGALMINDPVKTLTPKDISRYSFRDTINQIYGKAKSKYQDDKKKKLMVVTVDAEGGTQEQASANKTTSADTLKTTARAKTKEEATIKAKSALNEKNKHQSSGSLTVAGNTHFKAGNQIRLSEFGKMSGNWMIQSVRHSIERASGYQCELELARGLLSHPKKKKPLTVVGVKADGSIGEIIPKGNLSGKS